MINTLVQYQVWFLSGFALYSVYGLLAYNEHLKSSSYYNILGLCIALVGNLVWLELTKKISNNGELLYAGVLWDLVIFAAFLTASFTYGGIHLTWKLALGLVLVFIGLILIKV